LELKQVKGQIGIKDILLDYDPLFPVIKIEVHLYPGFEVDKNNTRTKLVIALKITLVL